MVHWNSIELKLSLEELSANIGVKADLEIDQGNNFSFTVVGRFPALFLPQVVRQQFAYYDAVPSRINPRDLGKRNVQAVLQRNMKKYGKTAGQNTLLELLEIKKAEDEMEIEYLNSVEKALFGQFNNG